jgi:hypothetical protein
MISFQAINSSSFHVPSLWLWLSCSWGWLKWLSQPLLSLLWDWVMWLWLYWSESYPKNLYFHQTHSCRWYHVFDHFILKLIKIKQSLVHHIYRTLLSIQTRLVHHPKKYIYILKYTIIDFIENSPKTEPMRKPYAPPTSIARLRKPKKYNISISTRIEVWEHWRGYSTIGCFTNTNKTACTDKTIWINCKSSTTCSKGPHDDCDT